MPLLVVVTAIILLVVALVVLTIFGTTMGTFATITQAKTHCINQFTASCKAANAGPPTWETVNVAVGGDSKTCSEWVSCSCSNFVPSCT